jgi:hypothetical protein
MVHWILRCTVFMLAPLGFKIVAVLYCLLVHGSFLPSLTLTPYHTHPTKGLVRCYSAITAAVNILLDVLTLSLNRKPGCAGIACYNPEITSQQMMFRSGLLNSLGFVAQS